MQRVEAAGWQPAFVGAEIQNGQCVLYLFWLLALATSPRAHFWHVSPGPSQSQVEATVHGARRYRYLRLGVVMVWQLPKGVHFESP